MMKRRNAALAAMVLCLPMALRAQTLPERFGYCFAIDVPSRAMWTTPVYEFDIAFGHLSEQMAQDAAQFRSRIAQGAQLAADTNAVCVYKSSHAEAEQEVEDVRKGFRFSRVHWTQVPWTPSSLSVRTQSPPPATPTASAPGSAPMSTPRPADTGDIETDYWNRIVDSQVAEDFDDYLKAFPKGRHAPLAQLEAKRLRRLGVGSVPVTSAASTPAPAVAEPGAPGLDQAVAQPLANDPFFRTPAGKGATATWSGRRIVATRVGDKVIETPVAQTSTVRRSAGTCQIDVHVEAGRDDVFVTDSHGATWAGMVPLDITGRSVNKYATGDTRTHAVSLRHGAQPLFPLRAGTAVEFGVTTQNRAGTTPASTFEQAWSCRVGATVPAQGVLPGTPGDATELACEMTMPGIPGSGSFAQTYQWFSDVGCFVQDPNRQ